MSSPASITHACHDHLLLQMIVQGSMTNANANLFAWTILDVDWSKYHINPTLDSYLHHAIICHGELQNMSRKFSETAINMEVKVSSKWYLMR